MLLTLGTLRGILLDKVKGRTGVWGEVDVRRRLLISILGESQQCRVNVQTVSRVTLSVRTVRPLG
jgi:hypothetical protein